ncbi:MAG: thiamine phosphate synthase, partial [Caldimicrobium sp.]
MENKCLKKLKGLYVITDDRLTPYEGGLIFQKVELALKGGAKIVQLRDKNAPKKALIPVAEKLKELCEKYKALFIVNDYIDIAKGVEANGVHIGKEDVSLEKALRELPGKIIGVSCYGSLERALMAEKIGASYVAFGSFFPSPTKPEASLVPLELIKKAKKTLTIPICAIGGITLERAKPLVELGADMLAVISDIWRAPSIEERAKAYAKLFLEVQTKE